MNKSKILVEYTSNDPNLIRHSDEMQDIITAIPSKLIRWGMFLFFCVFVMILGLAAFIHFPEVVNTTIMIKTNLTADMPIPYTDTAKVHAGQVVFINFKRNQLGAYKTIKGKITNVSHTSDNIGNVTVHVVIGRESNSGYFKFGMRGDAYIITNNFTVLERLFTNFIQ